MDHLCFFVSCVSHAFASLHCCLVVTCWERVDFLALVGDVYCIFVICQCGILGQVWYLIVSFPDFCGLSYFENVFNDGYDIEVKGQGQVYLISVLPEPHFHFYGAFIFQN